LQKSPVKRQYSAKETYSFKEPTNRSHPRASRTALHIVNIIQGVCVCACVRERVCVCICICVDVRDSVGILIQIHTQDSSHIERECVCICIYIPTESRVCVLSVS